MVPEHAMSSNIEYVELPDLDKDKARWRKELTVVMQLALPTIITTAAQQIMIVVNQVFAGHIGTDELAAAALSNTVRNTIFDSCSQQRATTAAASCDVIVRLHCLFWYGNATGL
eukprot:jgi/Chrzof1/13205/Cz07g24110.t1